MRGYLASDDFSDPVFFETDLGQTWPETPKPVNERRGSLHPMVAGHDGTDSLPGETVHQDFGHHESSGELDLFIPYATSLLEDLEAKTLSVDPLRYSPDDGLTVYRVKWAPGNGFFVPVPYEGFPGEYGLRMKFRVMSKQSFGS